MDKNKAEMSRASRPGQSGDIREEQREIIRLKWAKYIGLEQTAQNKKNRSKKADIKGEKLDLHSQDIVREKEVVRSNIYGTPRISKYLE